MIGVLNTPGFAEAQRQGICHFTGLPHIAIDGDHAVATSYLQILAADPDGKPFELSAHGTSKGLQGVSAFRQSLGAPAHAAGLAHQKPYHARHG